MCSKSTKGSVANHRLTVWTFTVDKDPASLLQSAARGKRKAPSESNAGKGWSR